jgi:hypothetical protein
MVGQHSEGSISWIPESSERLSFWVFLLLYIFKFYSDLRRFIMATGPTITSILAKQSDLLQKIDSIDNNIARIDSSISDLQEERLALMRTKFPLSRSLGELDDIVVNLICGSEEELRRFARVINRRLGSTQSSSEG